MRIRVKRYIVKDKINNLRVRGLMTLRVKELRIWELRNKHIEVRIKLKKRLRLKKFKIWCHKGEIKNLIP